MILRGAEAARYCARPDPARAGLLIFGADAMRVALKRQEAVAALIGPDGPGEMRLTRMPASDLRKDPARLGDALRETGFFPGPRVVLVEDATDTATAELTLALRDWRAGDAVLMVTAGELKGKSTLKTLFEKHPAAMSIGLYDDPPTREEIEAELARAGLSRIEPAAMADLTTLARTLDPGDFRQTLEKVGLYKWQDTSPLTPAEVAVLAPATLDTEMDDVLNAAAEGNAAELCLLMRRLEGQGVLPVTLCIQAIRHFRALHIAVTDPGGVQAGLMKARAYGTRRDKMQRQAQSMGVEAVEAAVAQLVDADLVLRSTSRAPGMALIERVLIRISRLRR